MFQWIAVMHSETPQLAMLIVDSHAHGDAVPVMKQRGRNMWAELD